MFVFAWTAAAASPSRFALNGIVGVQDQMGAANRQDVWRSRWVARRGAAISRGKHERHGMAALTLERAVAARLATVLAAAPAIRHHDDAGNTGGILIRRVQVGPGTTGGFDEKNVRCRSDGVSPFDVERDFEAPAGVVGGQS